MDQLMTIEQVLDIARALYDQCEKLSEYWSVVLANALRLQEQATGDYDIMAAHAGEIADKIMVLQEDFIVAQDKAIKVLEKFNAEEDLRKIRANQKKA